MQGKNRSHFLYCFSWLPAGLSPVLKKNLMPLLFLLVVADHCKCVSYHDQKEVEYDNNIVCSIETWKEQGLGLQYKLAKIDMKAIFVWPDYEKYSRHHDEDLPSFKIAATRSFPSRLTCSLSILWKSSNFLEFISTTVMERNEIMIVTHMSKNMFF